MDVGFGLVMVGVWVQGIVLRLGFVLREGGYGEGMKMG